MPVHHKVIGAVKQVGSKVIAGAKELGESSAVGISAAKEMVEGAVMPTAAQVTQFSPTPEGKKYLQEMMGSGDIKEGPGHWAYEMLSPANQTTQAYISRMMEQHKYPGDKNQLVKNINEMLASGYISTSPVQPATPGITVGPEDTAKSPLPQQNSRSTKGPKTKGRRMLPKIEIGRLTKRL